MNSILISNTETNVVTTEFCRQRSFRYTQCAVLSYFHVVHYNTTNEYIPSFLNAHSHS